MAKIDFSKLTDKQKRIMKASAIALAGVLLFLIIGVLLNSTTPPNPQTTGTVGSTVVLPGTQPSSGKGLLQGIRDFFAGNTSGPANTSGAIGQTGGTNAGTTQQGAGTGPSRSVPITDPRMQQQLGQANGQIETLENQITTLNQQLADAQQTLEDYQQSLGGDASQNPAIQGTIDGMEQQIEIYQDQIDEATAQLLIARMQIAYYFCQGVEILSTGSAPNLDDLANGTISLVNDDGTFNGAICDNLAGWTEQLADWFNARDLSIDNMREMVNNLVQGIFFYYCQGTSVISNNQTINYQEVVNGEIALVDYFGNFRAPQCPLGTEVAMTPTGDQTQFSSYIEFNATPVEAGSQVYYYANPPWAPWFPIFTTQLGNIAVGIYLYLDITIFPLSDVLGSGDSFAQQNLNREGLTAFLDPQGSSWQDGKFEIEGILRTQAYEVPDLTLEIRYGVSTRGLIPQLANLTPQEAVELFDSIPELQSIPIVIEDVENDDWTLDPVTLPAYSITNFYAEMADLDPTMPWLFDIIDAEMTMTVPAGSQRTLTEPR